MREGSGRAVKQNGKESLMARKVKTDILPPEDGPRLTPRQRRFCEEYMLDHNARAAAVRAGYQPDTATYGNCALMNKPAVQREIARREAKVSAENAALVKQAIEKLGELMLDEQVPHAVQLQSAKLILQMAGKLTERVEQDTTITIVVDNSIKEIGQ